MTNTILDIGNLQIGSSPTLKYLSLTLEGGYNYSFSKDLEIEALEAIKELKKPALLSLYRGRNNNEIILMEFDSAIIIWQRWTSGENQWGVTVSTKTLEELDAFVILFEGYLPVTSVKEDEARVTFYYLTNMGVRSYVRPIASSHWEDITNNYGESVSSSLESLMEMENPEERGKLILWHGSPGTGKSHAIRSLMLKWSSWCRHSYITDTDKFFNDPAYLLEVVMSEEDNNNPFIQPSHTEDNKKYHLIIIEDADELITTDAKQRSGQALTRLLNISDGLLGQGLRVLFLITTNEKIDDIHPAVIRNGRAMANIEFKPLDTASANEWLISKGRDVKVDKPTVLADLYSLLHEVSVVGSKKKKGKMGF